jgi:hypothetical protein
MSDKITCECCNIYNHRRSKCPVCSKPTDDNFNHIENFVLLLIKSLNEVEWVTVVRDNKLVVRNNELKINLFIKNGFLVVEAFELSIEIDIDKYLPVNIARQLEEVVESYRIKKDTKMLDHISHQLINQLNNVLRGGCS